MCLSEREERREYVANLALKIAQQLDGERGSNALLALLLNLEFMLEGMLNLNPPEDIEETLRELHELVIVASRTGAEALFGEPIEREEKTKMGIMKRMQMEEAEREYAKHLAELKAEADAEFPGEDWDPEVYEDYKRVMEKDD